MEEPIVALGIILGMIAGGIVCIIIGWSFYAFAVCMGAKMVNEELSFGRAVLITLLSTIVMAIINVILFIFIKQIPPWLYNVLSICLSFTVMGLLISNATRCTIWRGVMASFCAQAFQVGVMALIALNLLFIAMSGTPGGMHDNYVKIFNEIERVVIQNSKHTVAKGGKSAKKNSRRRSSPINSAESEVFKKVREYRQKVAREAKQKSQEQ